MLGGVERQALALGEPRERNRQHVAVARVRTLTLVRTLELVIREQEPAGLLGAEEALQLAPDPAVPVDQRAVAVECRPPVHRLPSWPKPQRITAGTSSRARS